MLLKGIFDFTKINGYCALLIATFAKDFLTRVFRVFLDEYYDLV